jgi:hypothetical protein
LNNLPLRRVRILLLLLCKGGFLTKCGKGDLAPAVFNALAPGFFGLETCCGERGIKGG